MPHDTKTILITGASSGIGAATAKLFAERGWNVAAAMRAPSRAHDWARLATVSTPAIDVSDADSCRRGVAETIDRFGRIDVLFNNAGYGLNGPVEGASEDQMHRQFDVNVVGVARMMQAVLPFMREQRNGLIITTSSIGGLIGMPISPFYIASKHAVEGLIESARFELKPFGVRLKLIEPGGIRTDFASRSAEWTDHSAYADHLLGARAMSSSLVDGSPDPSAVAEVVMRAACDRSDRLRYLAKPGPYVALYNLLPDKVWRGLIGSALNRQARNPRPEASASQSAT